MNEYIIINKTAILKRIEELEKDNKELAYSEEANPYRLGVFAGKIQELKQILSQSTPLIPEIDKAFDEGESNIDGEPCWMIDNKAKQNYISNLKLYI